MVFDGQMNLGEFVRALELIDSTDGATVLRFGLLHPSSYRGFYEQLAFHPFADVLVSETLECARAAIGKAFDGYKGGSYVMHERSPLWVASGGNLGWPLTRALFDFTAGL
jgi:hypothetical protein